MSIQSKQMFYVMLASVVLLVIAAGALTKLGLSVLQTKGDELTSLKEKQLVVKQREAALTRAKQDIKDYVELENISKELYKLKESFKKEKEEDDRLKKDY